MPVQETDNNENRCQCLPEKKIDLIVKGKCSSTGFYTPCRAWAAQCSLHRLLHSVWSIGAQCTGFYTQCGAWLKLLNVLKDLTQAFTLSVEMKELFKPNEERDIDLYTVKKIMHPRLPMYSSWGVSKLHDGLLYGQKWQIDKVIPWMAYYYEWSHGDLKKLRLQTLCLMRQYPGMHLVCHSVQFKRSANSCFMFFQGVSFEATWVFPKQWHIFVLTWKGAWGENDLIPIFWKVFHLDCSLIRYYCICPFQDLPINFVGPWSIV